MSGSPYTDRWSWKCDECGRFIGLNDYVDGRAMISVIRHFDDERIEVLCPRHTPLPKGWEVTRTDEHGNEVVVRSGMTSQEAEALCAKLTARGHKQFYQVRTSDDPCQESA